MQPDNEFLEDLKYLLTGNRIAAKKGSGGEAL